MSTFCLSWDGDEESHPAARWEGRTQGYGCYQTAFELVFLPLAHGEKPLGHFRALLEFRAASWYQFMPGASHAH